MNFEWDESKRNMNIVKHRLDFVYAMFVFEDSECLDFIDNRKEYGEERRITVGRIDKVVFVVVYTQRGSTIRIISFRHANKKEREKYYGNNKNDIGRNSQRLSFNS